MKKLFLIILFLLSSCVSSKNSTENNNFNFSKKMSFEEFGIKLKVYAEKNPYPNIDN